MKISKFITYSCAATLALALASGPALAKKNQPGAGAAEWFMKTNVHVVDPLDGSQWQDRSSGVFGKLAASSDGYDRHDIRVFASALSSPAALAFVRGEGWGEREGEYLSSYHEAGGSLDSWPFTVFSNVEGAEVTLTWDGIFELTTYLDGGLTRYHEFQTLDNKTLSKLKLVDLKTGEITDALTMIGQGKDREPALDSYTFYMEPDDGILDSEGRLVGHSRQFAWVLGAVKLDQLAANDKTTGYISKQQKELERLERKGLRVKHGPPNIDDMFLPPGKNK
jgi:hypothetical protein